MKDKIFTRYASKHARVTVALVALAFNTASIQKLYNGDIEVIQVEDLELNELRDSVKRLEAKVNQLLTQPKKRSGVLWKEFIVGFVVVYIVMMVVSVSIGFLNQYFHFFH
jgi:hypothetical protein